MEGKLITTKGLEAYTEQLKTFIDNTYQTKASMSEYTKTANLSSVLNATVATNAQLQNNYYTKKESDNKYGNPIYKHTITVVSQGNFRMSLTIFTTKAEKYEDAEEFRKDWAENRGIISVLAGASVPGTIFTGAVVGVIAASGGSIAVRISGIQAGGTGSNWDQIYPLNKWDYWTIQEDRQPNLSRI